MEVLTWSTWKYYNMYQRWSHLLYMVDWWPQHMHICTKRRWIWPEKHTSHKLIINKIVGYRGITENRKRNKSAPTFHHLQFCKCFSASKRKESRRSLKRRYRERKLIFLRNDGIEICSKGGSIWLFGWWLGFMRKATRNCFGKQEDPYLF